MSNDGAALSPAGNGRSNLQKQGGVNWYPGVWPAVSRSSKAAPVTEVARESISVAQNVASNITSSSTPQLDSLKQHRNPSLQLTRKAGASSRSLPADATTTKINIASDGSTSTPAVDSEADPAASSTSESANKEVLNDKDSDAQEDTNKEQPKTAAEVPSDNNTSPDTAGPDQPPSENTHPSGWLSWFYRPTTTEEVPAADSTDSTTETPAAPSENPPHKEDTVTLPDQEPTNPDSVPETSEISGTSQKRSWFQMWYGVPPPKGVEAVEATGDDHPTTSDETVTSHTNPAPTADQIINNPGESEQESEQPADAPSTESSAQNVKPSGWSFWFRDTSQGSTQTNPQEAELVEATKQDPPISKPDANESEAEQRLEVSKKGTVKIKPSKGSSAATDQALPEPEAQPKASTPSVPEAAASKQLQKILPNQVLPRFKETFALQERPSLFQTIGRFLSYSRESNNRHVYMTRDTPHIKRALAVGIHGYFPMPLIRSVLGQPTGTSVRFSNMAADAIQKWVDNHGYTCNIEKVALEGEGRIFERVDLLWKLLLNWMEEIRNADFIMFACHSQGVPVTIMLVAKLISFGCINAARVGICAMAGVNMGPFSEYRSRWISGSAGELFDFALPHSEVSKQYEAALKASLDFGVRISYIGSIDDQLVSLESSLFSPVTHPYIYRAVFVDGRVHAPSFVSHLVGFALKLRNLGIADHGLIRELSSPLAGSLYSGEGHSRLYDDEAVYRLAIEFALETSNVQGATIDIRRSPPSSQVNPYILPFAMRGLLEEEFVRRELYDETMQLLRQFDEWKPTSKVLKDVKFRLEGIRSKL
ncbi:uncharacterized protein KD926_009595 [Aspergillus affinis]|uniref:uncharacterized protein n=1 Tax=Aspergillus affinis TaxID=1070780 RepID=UPI0022FEA763|nr:uncharacterized protein KD926_009595 [Aspergillus affinis]KAI9045181.1 hypothetical protein KD926_009595 [Aspergillus affinis]